MHINTAAIREALTQSLYNAHNFLVDNKKTILISTLALSALGLGVSLCVAGSIYASGAALAKYAVTYHWHYTYYWQMSFSTTFAGLTPAGHTAVCAAMGAITSAITGAFAAGILMNHHSAPAEYNFAQIDDVNEL